MSSSRFSAPYSDEAIVAWLDGEMCADESQLFEQQLKRDQPLAERTADLMKSNQPFAEAFAGLLEQAPEARLQQQLNQLLAQQPVSADQRHRLSRRALMAASLSFLLLGSGLGYFARPLALSEDAKIRDLEAQYMSLYSAETLADVDHSPQMLQRSLARSSEQLELRLSLQQLVLADAELRSVRMLRYDESPIGQISWNHAEYGPMALCISREESGRQTPVSAEKRHGMNLAWWHDGGYQFVLIGRSPAAQLQQSAAALKSRLG